MNYLSQLKLIDLKIAFHNHCVSHKLSKEPGDTKKIWEPFWSELSTKCSVLPIGEKDD